MRKFECSLCWDEPCEIIAPDVKFLPEMCPNAPKGTPTKCEWREITGPVSEQRLLESVNRAKFTPGPWSVAGSGSQIDESRKFEFGIRTPVGLFIVDPYECDGNKFAANADLIASAPDMYARLQSLVDFFNEKFVRKHMCCADGAFLNNLLLAEEALKKARGESCS